MYLTMFEVTIYCFGCLLSDFYKAVSQLSLLRLEQASPRARRRNLLPPQSDVHAFVIHGGSLKKSFVSYANTSGVLFTAVCH